MRTKEGQEALRRVLEAVAFCLPTVSYCQGMNFIGSVLIQEAGEDSAFYIFMHLMFNQDMMPLFQAVSSSITKFNLLGLSRTASQEFPNGLTNQISLTEVVSTPS